MSSDSEDDTLLAQICQFVTTNSDSVLLQFPELFGLDDVSKRKTPEFESIAHLTLSPDNFRSQFQMSRECFADFLCKLEGSVRIFNLEKKLLFSILMLNSQESFEILGKCFNYSKSTAHLAFGEVLDGILGLLPNYVKWPSVNEYPEISQAFKDRSGGYIPGIVGAIGTCHLEIKTPAVNADDYKNHTNSHSIILQAVCDHRKLFTDVYVGSPGSRTEAQAFLESSICEQIEDLMPAEYHIVGEAVFPLMRNLMVPFRETENLSSNKQRFNEALRSAVVVADQALATLKAKFKKLKSMETASPEMASRIVCSCVTLYNHMRMYEEFEDEEKTGNSFISHEVVFDEEIKDLNEGRTRGGYNKRNFLMSLCD